ncbi:MAG: HEAT repeat domain-containing protein, partial [Planctomycetota bacterium]
MPKIKVVLSGFVLAIGITGIAVVYILISGSTIKKDVSKLKGWKPAKGISLNHVPKKNKKLGPINKVLKHKAKAVPYLVDALQKWEPEESKGVMIALGLLRAEKGLEPLVAVLKKEEGEAGAVAALALATYKEKSVSTLKGVAEGAADLTPPVRKHLYKAMVLSRNKDLFPSLLAALEDPDEGVAVYVAKSISSRKSESLVAGFLKGLQSGIQGVSDHSA